MKHLQDIIGRIDKLKPFSVTYMRIKKMLNDPYVSAHKIVDVVKYDQSFTANILKICNSALYRRSHKISNLTQAISLLGNNQLKQIILLESVNELLGESYRGYEINERELWGHSVMTALIAEQIGKFLGIKDIDTLFTAAILHDVGKVMLSEYVYDAFEEIVAVLDNRGMDFCAAEQQCIGIDHGTLGGKILQQWQFPDILVDAVQYHHQPEKCSHNSIVAIVHIADTIAMLMGMMTQRDGLRYTTYPQVCKKYGLSETDIERTIVRASSKIPAINEMIL